MKRCTNGPRCLSTLTSHASACKASLAIASLDGCPEGHGTSSMLLLHLGRVTVPLLICNASRPSAKRRALT